MKVTKGNGELFAVRWNLYLFGMLQGETIGLPGNSKGKIIRHLGLVYRPSSVQVEIKASEKNHSSAVKEDRKERMMVGYH